MITAVRCALPDRRVGRASGADHLSFYMPCQALRLSQLRSERVLGDAREIALRRLSPAP